MKSSGKMSYFSLSWISAVCSVFLFLCWGKIPSTQGWRRKGLFKSSQFIEVLAYTQLAPRQGGVIEEKQVMVGWRQWSNRRQRRWPLYFPHPPLPVLRVPHHTLTVIATRSNPTISDNPLPLTWPHEALGTHLEINHCQPLSFYLTCILFYDDMNNSYLLDWKTLCFGGPPLKES